MKLKDLREILKHYEGREYDDWEIELWDYNNQREAKWNGGTYASSQLDKKISFPITVDPIDGKTIDERIAELYKKIKEQENGTEKA